MYRIRLAALSLGLVGLHLTAACSSDNDGEPSEFFGDAGAPGERPTGGKTGSTPTGGRTGTIPVGGTTQGSGGAGDAGAADAGDPGSPSGGAISGSQTSPPAADQSDQLLHRKRRFAPTFSRPMG